MAARAETADAANSKTTMESVRRIGGCADNRELLQCIAAHGWNRVHGRIRMRLIIGCCWGELVRQKRRRGGCLGPAFRSAPAKWLMDGGMQVIAIRQASPLCLPSSIPLPDKSQLFERSKLPRIQAVALHRAWFQSTRKGKKECEAFHAGNPEEVFWPVLRRHFSASRCCHFKLRAVEVRSGPS